MGQGVELLSLRLQVHFGDFRVSRDAVIGVGFILVRISSCSLLIQKLSLGMGLTNEVGLFPELHVGAFRGELGRSSRAGLNIHRVSIVFGCLRKDL